MRSVSTADNVIPFRRPAGKPNTGFQGGSAAFAFQPSPAHVRARAEQRSLMEAVYASGGLTLAAEDRDNKLLASRLQVYGFLGIEEVGEDGSLRRLRPSEAVRARPERPWRLSKAGYGSDLSVTIPSTESFLFEQAGLPA
ncbi:hypothetical protein MMB17_10230 [Methylobacterium organophilum]|uniref:hypothetical protein n=1 Tax=Methylobacterium organophilum TaxID=410 RepID=UPI001F135345|nr:hypothetical protein [Methylobacterium organophilum]UMY19640.1 hypothetical protein MMB17_10230 [Methylobacterium organophilum]